MTLQFLGSVLDVMIEVYHWVFLKSFQVLNVYEITIDTSKKHSFTILPMTEILKSVIIKYERECAAEAFLTNFWWA